LLLSPGSMRGYAVVALFAATWAVSVLLWKTRRIEARWSGMIERS